MAFALAQYRFHAGLEGLQLLHGHKGLNSSGEAAAVDPERAAAPQQLPAQGQGQGNGLLLGIGGRPGVLQVQ